MIRDRCAGAFFLTYLTLLFSVAIGEAAGKTSSSQPICLARSWRDTEADYMRWPVCVESRWSKTTTIVPGSSATATTAGSDAVSTSSGTAGSSGSQQQEQDHAHTHDSELDTDSPLDNVKFLSFEDWKKQNLAKAGQSAENVGGSRRGGGVAGDQDRRRPTGISNALDSLGEDTEIELDFGGFGADAPEATRPPPFGAGVQKGDRLGAIGTGVGADANAPSSTAVLRAGTMRRRDAGTTCKERFNYASFDCAATVLKTNPECQGSSSVLIENKDSYMLNECRATNKFLILELCDDILVDTVVLANYEFFSSIFRTFRVSVSDRYPAKMDQWRELGVYEARNTREVQAFAVENPLIWARYLKIEFLTHYGNEFYCPLSLIRVHGTTMLEEYKHDGDVARGDDDIGEEALELGQGAGNVESAKPLETPSIGPGVVKEPEVLAQGTCLNPGKAAEAVLIMGFLHEGVCGRHGVPILPPGHDGAAFVAQNGSLPKDTGPVVYPEDPATNVPGVNASTQETVDARRAAGQPGTDSIPSPSATTSMSETVPQDTTFEADPRATAPTQEEHAPPPESTKTTMVQPPSPNPTTQESFFKSVNKRLQMLESNSTLSLLYIEEQSRILRDAFSKVEKRQLAKTSTFLETLNVTVLTELRDFRDQYDQVWKTVALEFETQRIQYHQELFSLSAQLGVLADELVFQKRVAVIQSIMVLFCFGLILFSRGAVGSYIELPSVQNMVSRSYSLRSSSPPFRFGSPSASPGSTRAASSYHGGGHHRHSSEDFQDSQDSPPSPTIAYAPPTPTSETSSPMESIEKREPSPSPTPNNLEMPDLAPPHCRSQSSPPVLKTEGEDGDEDTTSESLGP